MNKPNKLRIGILLDSFEVEFWVYELVQNILADSRLDLCLVVLNSEPPTTTLPLFYRMFCRWDHNRATARGMLDAKQDLSSLLKGISTLNITPRSLKYSDYFAEDDIEQICSYDPDIILRLGFRILRGEILNSARFGVWSYHHGDNDFYRGGPPGFWEVYEATPVTGTTLQVITEELDAGFVIQKTFQRTHPTCPAVNLAESCRKGILLFSQAIDRLCEAQAKPEHFLQTMTTTSDSYHKPIYQVPNTPAVLSLFLKIAYRIFCSRLRGEKDQIEWTIGVSKRQHPTLLKESLKEVSWYEPEGGNFLADPFLLPVASNPNSDSKLLFVEEFSQSRNLGHISVLEVDTNGNFSKPRKVLESDFHLSFPFVFKDNNDFFLLPEQSSAGQVTLYKATDFPNTWSEGIVLLPDFKGIDSVILFHENKYWLFSSNGAYSNHDSNLYVFYSDKLEGPYTPHVKNPIKSTLRGSRMAGQIFIEDGKIFRPSQNCTRRYGGSVIIQQINQLSETEFEEREVREILPSRNPPYSAALHTINSDGKITVIDGMRFPR